jgi:F-type H+-transporting ATPase subunit b
VFVSLAQAATEAHVAATQAGGLAALGLDVRALLWQIVNFAILLWLLHRFAYKPLLKLLEDRRQTVAESLENAADIERTRHQLTQETERLIKEAQREAQAKMAASEKRGADIIAAAETTARQQAERIVAQAETRITTATAEARETLTREALELVALACEKVLREKLDTPQDTKLIKEALEVVARAQDQ